MYNEGKITCSDIYMLRRKGHKEEAYEAARQLYSIDKTEAVATVMFWTAVDVLKIRVSESRMEDARKIYMALERLFSHVADENGWMNNTMKKCHTLIEEGEIRENRSNNGPMHMQMGIWGEDVAVSFLKKKGYMILERDWRSKHRDIDIVCTTR